MALAEFESVVTDLENPSLKDRRYYQTWTGVTERFLSLPFLKNINGDHFNRLELFKDGKAILIQRIN